MAIKVGRQRAKVSDAFIVNSIEAVNDRMKRLHDQYGDRGSTMKHYAKKMLRAVDLGSGECGSVERFKTELRGTPFLEFDYYYHKNNNMGYLVGETVPIILKSDRGQFDVGRYLIYVPKENIVFGNLSRKYMHYVPKRNPTTESRHPHHGGYGPQEHWLDKQSKTCWGGFGSLVNDNMCDANIVGLFAILYTYLSRWAPRDQYTRWDYNNFEQVGPAIPEPRRGRRRVQPRIRPEQSVPITRETDQERLAARRLREQLSRPRLPDRPVNPPHNDEEVPW